MADSGGFPLRGRPGGDRSATAPSAQWCDPETLPETWTWTPGRVCLGHDGRGRRYGVEDPRHVVTIAGSRAGKTRHVIVPNLREYPGSAFVIDPKGELARETGKDREKFGPVYVLDPFGVTGRPTDIHNPFDELRRSPEATRAADAALVADALIIGTGSDTHWTDSARNLVKGFILQQLTLGEASLDEVLRLVSETPQELDQVFRSMIESEAFDGVMANIGASFYAMLERKEDQVVGYSREMASILSAARQQLAPLGDVKRVTTGASSFDLADLGRKAMTVYLVLPGLRLGTHYRWLRLVLMQALAAMEMNPVLHGRPAAWFVLEEFAALGHVRAIETAAGYMAGFGVKLWAVLQDISQLRTHYRDSWETFLGNAGIVQAFGNVDNSTLEYLSKRLGEVVISERRAVFTSSTQRAAGHPGEETQVRSVPLLAPFEIEQHFAASTKRHLILVSGERPTYMRRLGD